MQQPPQGSYQPGTWQDPTLPYAPVPPMPPVPPRKPTMKERWKGSRKRTKVGIGCLTGFILILALCTCSTIASAFAPHTNTTANAGTIATNTPTQVAQIIQTQAPTAIPTQQPTPTSQPTKAPTPTPVPTQPPTPTPVPTVYVQPTTAPVPTQAPAPTPVPTQAPPTGTNGNPWGYNFTPGNLIYSPNAAFCDYFACVSTFWTATRGYVAECYNGSYTHSGGVSGACSRDGGVEAILYSH